MYAGVPFVLYQEPLPLPVAPFPIRVLKALLPSTMFVAEFLVNLRTL